MVGKAVPLSLTVQWKLLGTVTPRAHGKSRIYYSNYPKTVIVVVRSHIFKLSFFTQNNNKPKGLQSIVL